MALAAAGWGWFLLRGSPAEAPAPVKAASIPPLPPAESSQWFDRVEDRTPLNHIDNLVYAQLLEKVRSTPPATLAKQARREVTFGQLFKHPDRYRGLPVHLDGTARRVVINEGVGPGFSTSGRLHEAWTFTMDSQRYPYCLVFETPPADLNLGPDVYERVAFDGYFLKLMSYNAADSKAGLNDSHVAPLLIGRLTKFADPTPTMLLPRNGPARRNAWIVIALVGAASIALFRVILMFRRKRKPTWQPSPTFRPSEEVDPEALADWLNREDENEREPWQTGETEGPFH